MIEGGVVNGNNSPKRKLTIFINLIIMKNERNILPNTFKLIGHKISYLSNVCLYGAEQPYPFLANNF
jgi:hypothetical protein